MVEVGVVHLYMKSAQNTLSTKGNPKWHPKFVAPLVRGRSDPSVDDGPGRWERLLPMDTKRHKGKAISYE